MIDVTARHAYPPYRAFRQLMSVDFANHQQNGSSHDDDDEEDSTDDDLCKEQLVQFYLSTLVDLIGRLLEPIRKAADARCLNVGAGFALCCALIERHRFDGRIDLADWNEACVQMLRSWKSGDGGPFNNVTEIGRCVDNLQQRLGEDDDRQVHVALTADVRERVDRVLQLTKGVATIDQRDEQYDMVAVFLPKRVIADEDDAALAKTLSNVISLVKEGRCALVCGKGGHASEVKKVKITLENLGTEIFESYEYELPVQRGGASLSSSASESHFICIVNCSNWSEHS